VALPVLGLLVLASLLCLGEDVMIHTVSLLDLSEDVVICLVLLLNLGKDGENLSEDMVSRGARKRRVVSVGRRSASQNEAPPPVSV
jgi:hypothetical protein